MASSGLVCESCHTPLEIVSTWQSLDGADRALATCGCGRAVARESEFAARRDLPEVDQAAALALIPGPMTGVRARRILELRHAGPS